MRGDSHKRGFEATARAKKAEFKAFVKSEVYGRLLNKWATRIDTAVRLNFHDDKQRFLKDVEVYELFNILDAMKQGEIVEWIYNNFRTIMDYEHGRESAILRAVTRIFATILFCGDYDEKFRAIKRALITRICTAAALYKNKIGGFEKEKSNELSFVAGECVKFSETFRKIFALYLDSRPKNENGEPFANELELMYFCSHQLGREKNEKEERERYNKRGHEMDLYKFRALLAKTARRDEADRQNALKTKIRARVEYPIKSGFKVFDETARDICTAIIDEEKEKIREEIQRLRAQIARLDEQRKELNKSHVILNPVLGMAKLARAMRRAAEQKQKTA